MIANLCNLAKPRLHRAGLPEASRDLTEGNLRNSSTKLTTGLRQIEKSLRI